MPESCKWEGQVPRLSACQHCQVFWFIEASGLLFNSAAPGRTSKCRLQRKNWRRSRRRRGREWSPCWRKLSRRRSWSSTSCWRPINSAFSASTASTWAHWTRVSWIRETLSSTHCFSLEGQHMSTRRLYKSKRQVSCRRDIQTAVSCTSQVCAECWQSFRSIARFADPAGSGTACPGAGRSGRQFGWDREQFSSEQCGRRHQQVSAYVWTMSSQTSPHPAWPPRTEFQNTGCPSERTCGMQMTAKTGDQASSIGGGGGAGRTSLTPHLLNHGQSRYHYPQVCWSNPRLGPAVVQGRSQGARTCLKNLDKSNPPRNLTCLPGRPWGLLSCWCTKCTLQTESVWLQVHSVERVAYGGSSRRAGPLQPGSHRALPAGQSPSVRTSATDGCRENRHHLPHAQGESGVCCMHRFSRLGLKPNETKTWFDNCTPSSCSRFHRKGEKRGRRQLQTNSLTEERLIVFRWRMATILVWRSRKRRWKWSRRLNPTWVRCGETRSTAIIARTEPGTTLICAFILFSARWKMEITLAWASKRTFWIKWINLNRKRVPCGRTQGLELPPGSSQAGSRNVELGKTDTTNQPTRNQWISPENSNEWIENDDLTGILTTGLRTQKLVLFEFALQLFLFGVLLLWSTIWVTALFVQRFVTLIIFLWNLCGKEVHSARLTPSVTFQLRERHLQRPAPGRQSTGTPPVGRVGLPHAGSRRHVHSRRVRENARRHQQEHR